MKFEKGKSGNPGGRPKESQELKAIFLAACPGAIEKLIALLDSADPDLRLKAIKEVLDRSLGKAAQAITGEGGGPVQVVVNVITSTDKS